MSASSQANAVPDTQLGLSNEEIQLLRQGQAALGQGGGGGGSSSSRAASRASSQGLLLLDSTSLAALGRYFDRVMNQIEGQMAYLSEQSQVFTMAQFDHAGNLIGNADAEIQRYNDILQQLDELELDFDRIRHIKEIVRGFRSRVETMERELERSGGSSSSRHREGHHSSRHGHSSRHESSRRHRH
ncbi:hypothetical protein B0T11DRAFT_82154 [Plectosphaerella cucumerina]|uniref:Biogenesis of lysosome-related organelles complex 1 subunit CNL1 n=1 Tax=Plectosphaerella cucumerina TaxID=40658 RepID=A0A8K0X4B1_9PEZI|nr:hypothetical protein B0T11DRAFT_82154 [Plectosphaerella cucumerina]